MKKISELHIGKYEISNEDVITRIHFSNRWQIDGKLRVKFLERKVVDELGQSVRDGSHDIMFYSLKSLDLAKHYCDVMKHFIENANIKYYSLTGSKVTCKECEITTNYVSDHLTKEDLIRAVDKSLKELQTLLNSKNKEMAD